MTDRPILFSAPMVRALLDGRKTQTRRILKPQPELLPNGTWHVFNSGGGTVGVETADMPAVAPDYVRYEVGDRLWVRETWAPVDAIKHNDPGTQALADNGFYRADQSVHDDEITTWKPSIFMPRWASRLTLIVIDVRVQRLQDCNDSDAIAEGVTGSPGIDIDIDGFWWPNQPKKRYRELWDRINGAGAWEANPWVVAIIFEVLKRNIDEVA